MGAKIQSLPTVTVTISSATPKNLAEFAELARLAEKVRAGTGVRTDRVKVTQDSLCTDMIYFDFAV